MKYIVFMLAVLGVPPLAFLLSANLRWARYALWGMMGAVCLYQSTAINFFSHEDYTGSARGMEVSLVHLFSLAILVALGMKHKFRSWFPERGFQLYALYFILCLPSLTAADDCLISWLEIWKMIMTFLVYLAVYSYLVATDDVRTLVKSFVFLAIVNFGPTVSQHYSARYQAHGIFPHWNCMAMALHLVGTLLFAYYLTHGVRKLYGKICFVGFACSVLATLWSYSRGAFLVMPICYGLTLVSCFLEGRGSVGKLKRLLPIALVCVLGVAVILPRVIERFVTAPKASGDTRVELAYCAWEMIRDEPLRGVGINNWSLKMSPPHTYQENASVAIDRDLNYTGIVETVYLLVGAECGIPALLAMVAWFGWYVFVCVRLLWRLKGTEWYFIPAGLLGGLTANYLQSVLEWVLRQPMNLICLVFVFALLSYLDTDWQRLRKAAGA